MREVGGRCEGVCGGSEIELNVRNATRGVRTCMSFFLPRATAKPGRWLLGRRSLGATCALETSAAGRSVSFVTHVGFE